MRSNAAVTSVVLLATIALPMPTTRAQNTTGEPMQMFLTRLGYNSKAVSTGAITQVAPDPGVTTGAGRAARVPWWRL